MQPSKAHGLCGDHSWLFQDGYLGPVIAPTSLPPPHGALGLSAVSLWCVCCVYLRMCDMLWRDAFAHKSSCCGEFSQDEARKLKVLVTGCELGSLSLGMSGQRPCCLPPNRGSHT